MKKIILLSSVLFTALQGFAQTFPAPVADTVSTGGGYTNQVYYKLSDGSRTIALNEEWDLGFQTGLMTAGVHFNNVATNRFIYAYPNAAANDLAFDDFDTTGYTSWKQLYNTETSWDNGALNTTAAGSQFDYGWGSYDVVTHGLVGDSLYLVKKGSTLYKLWIKAKPATNSYIFRYADFFGNVDVTDTVFCNNYSGKNLVYYNLTTGQVIDREPADWQLLFTRYFTFIQGQYYRVAGALSNAGVQVAQVGGLADTANFTDTTGAPFSTDINIIGSDWKTINGNNDGYNILDSTVYFVLTQNNELYKIIMTDFDGGAALGGNGTSYFTKQLLSPTLAVVESPITNTTLYPNPTANGQATTLVYSLNANSANASVAIYDLAGKLVSNQLVNGQTGLHTMQLPTEQLAPGMYIVNLLVNNASQNIKLIVR